MADSYPNEILAGKLWLGSWMHAADVNVIESLRITHILNISEQCDCSLQTAGLKYKQIQLRDAVDARIDDQFSSIFSFLNEALQLSGIKWDGDSGELSNHVLQINFKD